MQVAGVFLQCSPHMGAHRAVWRRLSTAGGAVISGGAVLENMQLLKLLKLQLVFLLLGMLPERIRARSGCCRLQAQGRQCTCKGAGGAAAACPPCCISGCPAT